MPKFNSPRVKVCALMKMAPQDVARLKQLDAAKMAATEALAVAEREYNSAIEQMMQSADTEYAKHAKDVALPYSFQIVGDYFLCTLG